MVHNPQLLKRRLNQHRPGSIAISFNGQSLECGIAPIRIRNVDIRFGQSSHPKFHTNDVPPMSIRNVRVSDSQGRAVAYWPLKKHAGNQSLDSLHRIPACTANPVWEINRHTRWREIQRFTLPEEALLIPQELEESLLRVQHPMVEEPDLDRTYRIVTPLAVGEQVILLAAGGQYLILGRIGVPGRIRHMEEV